MKFVFSKGSVWGFIVWLTAGPAVFAGNLSRERALVASKDPQMMELLGQRFIDPEDWAVALDGLRPQSVTFPRHYVDNEWRLPQHAYGPEAFEAYLKGLEFVHENCLRSLPTVDDMRELYRHVHYGSPGGDTFLATGKEIQVLRTNHRLTIEVGSRDATGRYLIRVRYPDAAKVEGMLADAFARMHLEVNMLRRTRVLNPSWAYLTRVTEIAGQFYQTLVEVHALEEGNGLTSRLMRDWVLWHLGLDAAASTPREHLGLSRSDYTSRLKEDVLRTGLLIHRIHGSCSNRLKEEAAS